MPDTISMSYEEAKARLRNHAGLVSGDPSALDEHSLLYVLFKAERDNQAPSVIELEQLYGDILQCLHAVNIELNGDLPSETIEKTNQVERTLVGSLWYILEEGWQYQQRWSENKRFEKGLLDYLSTLLKRISLAWGAVLDGDIDSLFEHVQQVNVVTGERIQNSLEEVPTDKGTA